MNKKGFTLIELLAVIVILAIIALIATPIVISIIDDSRKEAAERSAESYLNAVENAIMKDRMESELIEDGTYKIVNGQLEGTTLEVEISGEYPTDGRVSIVDGKVDINGTSMIIGDYSVSFDGQGNIQVGKKPELEYYNDIYQIIGNINSGNSNGTGEVSGENAEFAYYVDENDKPNLVILKDLELESEFVLSTDMIIDLGGKTLAFDNELGIKVTSGDVTIKGEAAGSKVVVSNDTQASTVLKVDSGSCTISGGTYQADSNGIGTDQTTDNNIVVGSTGTLIIDNAKILSNDTEGGTLVGVYVNNGGTATVTNSDIEINSLNGLKSDGIRNYGTMTLTNTSIAAYSNYTANAAKNDYATSTRGINNEGTMILKNCYVYGAHSGIRSLGTLYVDGGTYEGYGHGGFYFGGASTTSYVKNATVRLSDIKVGYDDGIAGSNKAGFYVGGASNITIYVDKCEISGSYYPFVLRSSGGESNNNVYISNSNINKDTMERYIRNDGSSNKVYIGVGNNFGIVESYKESGSIETTDNYSSQFPEY